MLISLSSQSYYSRLKEGGSLFPIKKITLKKKKKKKKTVKVELFEFNRIFQKTKI